MKGKNFLGFFAKFPEPGKVKTRLARHIGAEKAATVYRRIAEYVLQRTAPSRSGYCRIIFYTPDTLKQRFEDWLPGEVLMPQKGPDIGERMDSALQEMFARGAEKAIVVGADIPELRRGIIEQAFEELDNADIVIGPARDGGYYLIGMKSAHPEIFRNITWSTGTVLQETVQMLSRSGLRYRTVATLSDVDTPDDVTAAEEILKDADH